LATIDLANLGAGGVTVYGADPGDFSGFSVDGAGDVNGDGFDDLLIGAILADAEANGKTTAGEGYVIFGSASLPGTIDLGSLNALGMTIYGASPDDNCGRSVSGAGDVNGDGFDDLLIGAPSASSTSSGESFAGRSYVILGSASLPDAIDLSDMGVAGITFSGVDLWDQSGHSISNAGDVNGDGLNDILIGAHIGDAAGNGKTNAGDSYVVFGSADLAGTIHLASLGTAGITMHGADAGDESGWAVSNAGDVDGDGFDDLLIGARSAAGAGNSRDFAGDSFVVFGSATLSGSVELASIGEAGIHIYGAESGDASGYSVSGAGDVNGDGFDDILIGAPGASVTISYVVFGGANLPETIDLISLGTGGILINAADTTDWAGRTVSGAGDVNGDGFDELLIGAELGDAEDDGKTDAGDSYLIFGGANLPGTIELDNLGTLGLTMYGVDIGDSSGFSAGNAGDVNGDGFDDFTTGAVNADAAGDGKNDAGESYLVFGGNLTSSVTHEGSDANDTLTGDGAANVMVGGRGADTLMGAGGADVLRGGEGDDVLAVGDVAFSRVVGGNGVDTLRLDTSGATLSLTGLSDNRILGIEQIDITGSGANILRLDVQEVLNISDESNTLIVRRDADDIVTDGGGWTREADETIGGDTFAVFTQGAATLKLQNTRVAITFTHKLTDLNGNPLPNLDGDAQGIPDIFAGQDFLYQVYAQDTRDTDPLGMFSAYLVVPVDFSLVTPAFQEVQTLGINHIADGGAFTLRWGTGPGSISAEIDVGSGYQFDQDTQKWMPTAGLLSLESQERAAAVQTAIESISGLESNVEVRRRHYLGYEVTFTGDLANGNVAELVPKEVPGRGLRSGMDVDGIGQDIPGNPVTVYEITAGDSDSDASFLAAASSASNLAVRSDDRTYKVNFGGSLDKETAQTPVTGLMNLGAAARVDVSETEVKIDWTAGEGPDQANLLYAVRFTADNGGRLTLRLEPPVANDSYGLDELAVWPSPDWPMELSLNLFPDRMNEVEFPVAAVLDIIELASADDEFVEVAEDSGETLINVLDGDTTRNGAPRLEGIVPGSGPTNGWASLVGSQIAYQPNPNFNGQDGFVYEMSDGLGNTDRGTVFITVTAVNDISGTKYEDGNGDGMGGTDDVVSSTGTVMLYADADDDGVFEPGGDDNEAVDTRRPNANGAYSFGHLDPRRYFVAETPDVGWIQTGGGDDFASGENYYTVVITNDEDVTGKDFANAELGSISGTKYEDVSGDGLGGSDDVVSSAATIVLYADVDDDGQFEPGGDDNGPVETKKPGTTGTYTFTILSPGRYFVAETPDPGWIQTGGGDDFPSEVGYYTVLVTFGTHVTGKDFANTPAFISGTKYEDVNGDGLGGGDDVISNAATIMLYADVDDDGVFESGDDDGEPVNSRRPDINGTYSFSHLSPGRYFVGETPDANWAQTGGGDDFAGGVDYYTVVITSGARVTGKDFSNHAHKEFGDAPSSYPVTLAEDGARHTATGPTLGMNRDVEADGIHSANADADDFVGVVAPAATSGAIEIVADAGNEPEAENGGNTDLVAFAQDLALNDVKLYGSNWCRFCVEQKKLFEDGAQFLPYVNLYNADGTRNNEGQGITSIPVWEFPDGNGGVNQVVGKLTLEQISAESGIAIPNSDVPWVKPIDEVIQVLAGSPLHMPFDGYDPNGDPLTYDVSVQDVNGDPTNQLSAEVLEGNRSMRVNVLSHAGGFTMDMGEMVFELFEQRVPRPTDRLIELTESGYYDDNYFYRLEPGFILAGGGATATEGGSSTLGTFDDQFHVDLQHNRDGVLSYVKGEDDTNDALYFVTLGPARHLDFQHSVSGQLVEGFDLLRDIQEEPVVPVDANSTTHSPEFPKQVGVLATFEGVEEQTEIFTDTENAVVMLDADEAAVGQQFTVMVIARDPAGNESTIAFDVTVAADIAENGGANGGPFLEEIGPIVTTPNTPAQIQLSALDIEGDPVFYDAAHRGSMNYELDVNNETGLVTITPPQGFAGDLEVLVGVRALNGSDTADAWDRQLVTVTVAGPVDDEDGVTFAPIMVGQLNASVTVNVQNAPNGARLDAWIDFDGDGSWDGPSDQIADGHDVSEGDNAVMFDVPGWAREGTTYARFRLSTAGNLDVVGLAADGEVEDHPVTIVNPCMRGVVALAFGAIGAPAELDEYELDIIEGPNPGVYSLVVVAEPDGLDPDAVQVRDAAGIPVVVTAAIPDVNGGSEQSVSVASLAPGLYRLVVAGQRGTAGEYRVEVRMPGDLDCHLNDGFVDNAVVNREVQLAQAAMLQRNCAFDLIAQELFGQKLGIDLSVDQFRAEFDANLNGHIDAMDMDAIITNNGSGAAVLARAVLAPVANSSPAEAMGESGNVAAFALSDIGFSVFQNPERPTDVNADKYVTPLDALLVIGAINAQGSRGIDAAVGGFDELASEGESNVVVSSPFFDVNGDYALSPLDALLVISDLVATSSRLFDASSAEGEAVASVAPIEPNEAWLGSFAVDQPRNQHLIAAPQPSRAIAVVSSSPETEFGYAIDRPPSRAVGQARVLVFTENESLVESIGLDRELLDTLVEDVARAWAF